MSNKKIKIKVMKKFLIAIIAIFCMIGSAEANKFVKRDDSSLPAAAKATISKNFKAKISLIKSERKYAASGKFEVILTDGTEITFDKYGNWEDVEVPRGKSVPDYFVPKKVKDYVKKTHSGQKIEGIEIYNKGYNVELSNDVEMKFDRDGNFLRYDN